MNDVRTDNYPAKRESGRDAGSGDEIPRAADVSEALWQRLADFRQTHPFRELDVDGFTWRYLCSGSGNEALILLPGAFGEAVIGFHLIEAFERHHKVIAPSWPPVGSVSTLITGVEAILDREGIRRTSVLGGSFGGAVAQSWARANPGRIDKLILSHTIAPDPSYSRRMAITVQLARMIPAPLARRLLRKRVGGLIPESFVARKFWEGFLIEIAETLPKSRVIAVLRCLRDFIGNDFAPDELAGWENRILVLESDNDTSVKEKERAALRALYPQAEVHTFHGTGHASSILEPETYTAVVGRFLSAAPG